MNSSVDALIVHNNRLIAGGWFTVAGGVTANYLASWDGASWSSLGSGMNDGVQCFTIYNNMLIAGGRFTIAGGVPANNIASWDGTAWSPLGLGLGSDAYSLTIFNNRLIAAGWFTTAGGVNAKKIASWDGTTWSPLGLGFSTGYVFAVAVYDNKLIAGGSLPNMMHAIASWNGTTWTTLGSGTNYVVRALTLFDNKLIAGGEFTTAGNVTANHIAPWNGNSWSPLGSGMSNNVYALTVYAGKLIAGGSFSSAGGVNVYRIASWNGSAWTPLGTGMSSIVYALTVYDGKLIAGGVFTTADGVSANRIASWNGSAWTPLGSGMDGNVYALTVYGQVLIAAGNFVNAGGVTANRIASWDGTVWSPLGTGLDQTVLALTVYNNLLITGGYFYTAGGIGVEKLASWDGTTWSSVGTWGGLSSTDEVRAMVACNNKLFIGGIFATANATTNDCIASWNGNTWSSLGSGTDGEVFSLMAHNDTLLVSGDFTIAGNKVAAYLAKWTKVEVPSHVATQSPIPNELNVPRTSTITATFDMDMNPSTINANTFVVTGNTAGRVEGNITCTGNTAIFTPDIPYPAGEKVTVVLTIGIESAAGVPLAQGYTWSFTAAVSGSTGFFSSATTIPSGTAEGAIATADFNGDGYADLVQASGTIVSVMMNNTTGGFAPYVLYQVSAAPGCAGLAVADYDGDGDIDIAIFQTTGSYDNYISLMLNDGGGIFTVQPSFSYGTGNARGICTADFDADGHADLAVALRSYIETPYPHDQGQVVILFNYGDATFHSPGPLPVHEWTDIIGLWTADIDGDGYFDLATSNGGAYFTVFFNNDHGLFPTYLDLASPYVGDVEVADFDGDSDVDIVAFELGSHGMSGGRDAMLTFYEGLGDRQFALNTSLAINAWATSTAAGDIDGDGDVDLIATFGSPSYVHGDFGPFSNLGGFSFQGFTWVITQVNPTSMVLSDHDNDGDLDLAVVCSQAYVDRSVNIHKNLACVDTDGDGFGDPGYPENACTGDNCPWIYNPDQGGDCTFAGETPEGTNVIVPLGLSVDLTFGDVLTAGTTEMTMSYTGPGVSGLQIIPADLPIYYNITTTAGYSGLIEVCVDYDDAGMSPSQENMLRLIHYDGTDWADITASADTASNTICGTSESLSPFVVGYFDYICGDVNGSKTVNILDVTYLISYLYKGGPSPDPIEAADVNSSGTVNILDVTYLIGYLYKGGPEPNCP